MSEPELRRQQILDAAERLLRHYGPGKTTIADIAQEADIGVGTVYLVFDSKEEIIAELSGLCHEQVLKAMRAAADARAARHRDRFRAVLNARLEAFLRLAEHGAHARDLLHCVRPAVKSAYASFETAERTLFADMLRAAAKAKEFAVSDPEMTARIILRSYASFSPPWLFSQRPEEIRPLHTSMHDLVLRGLLRRTP